MWYRTRQQAELARRRARKYLAEKLDLMVNPKNDVIVPARAGLHFLGHVITHSYVVVDKHTTQLVLAKAQVEFSQAHAGASLRATDHRDFLVWYIMDLLREVSAAQVVLAKGFMRVPVLGRRTVDGDSYVGNVNVNAGQANLDRSNGNANDDNGVGLSVGLKEELAPPFLLID